MADPRVTVLMSVYNGEQYLAEAVNSLLDQTFTDFEFVVIDDGSTDGTRDMLRCYTDPRIRVFEQSNIGLTRSLNRGISLARGQYIARMDHDDLSMPDRLARQVSFLDAYPEVGIVGTACRIRDEIKGLEWEPPVHTSDEELRRNLVRGNPFIHTSVMMRKALLDMAGGYDESYSFAQDYALWIQLAPHTKMANLPEVLVVHREHWGTVTAARTTRWGMVWRSVWVRMGLRYRAFRSQKYPPHYILYVAQPILYTLVEIRAGLAARVREVARLERDKFRHLSS
jgi:glycosyltransferase involved in cell wall biosynthesis